MTVALLLKLSGCDALVGSSVCLTYDSDLYGEYFYTKFLCCYLKREIPFTDWHVGDLERRHVLCSNAAQVCLEEWYHILTDDMLAIIVFRCCQTGRWSRSGNKIWHGVSIDVVISAHCLFGMGVSIDVVISAHCLFGMG